MCVKVWTVPLCQVESSDCLALTFISTCACKHDNETILPIQDHTGVPSFLGALALLVYYQWPYIGNITGISNILPVDIYW